MALPAVLELMDRMAHPGALAVSVLAGSTVDFVLLRVKGEGKYGDTHWAGPFACLKAD